MTATHSRTWAEAILRRRPVRPDLRDPPRRRSARPFRPGGTANAIVAESRVSAISSGTSRAAAVEDHGQHVRTWTGHLLCRSRTHLNGRRKDLISAETQDSAGHSLASPRAVARVAADLAAAADDRRARRSTACALLLRPGGAVVRCGRSGAAGGLPNRACRARLRRRSRPDGSHGERSRRHWDGTSHRAGAEAGGRLAATQRRGAPLPGDPIAYRIKASRPADPRGAHARRPRPSQQRADGLTRAPRQLLCRQAGVAPCAPAGRPFRWPASGPISRLPRQAKQAPRPAVGEQGGSATYGRESWFRFAGALTRHAERCEAGAATT